MAHSPQHDATASTNALSDQALAAGAQRGDSECFAELVGRWDVRIYNFLVRRVRCAADAEDLTQDTFVRAWRQIATYRPNRRFSTWLFTIAGRLAIDHHRAERHSAREHRDVIDQDDRVSVAAVEARAAAHERGSALWCLAAELLNEQQHAALWLRYAEDMAIKDIAAAMGRTQVAVRVMLMRARNLLAHHARSRFRHSDASSAIERGVACPVR